ncbi:MAG: hypothetical protein AAGF11_31140 [Myxococcota bacterium]
MALLPLVTACDLGDTNIGQLPASYNSAKGQQSCPTWDVAMIEEDDEQTPAHAILSLSDGMLLGGAPTSSALTRLDASGQEVWSVELGTPGLDFIANIETEPGGDYVVAMHRQDPVAPYDKHLWIGAVSDNGQLQWESVLGAAHMIAGMQADIQIHPAGGYVVSWHSGKDGNSVLELERTDDSGTPLWGTSYPLTADSMVAYNWSKGAMDLLPNGDILQLTAQGDGLRLVRTTPNGGMVSDVAIPQPRLWPQELTVLPDGRVFVLGNDSTQQSGVATLLEVEPDGTIIATHEYSAGEDPFLTSMHWNDAAGRLLLSGTTRNSAEDQQRQWHLAVDAEGIETWSYFDEQDSIGSDLNDISATPDGGFITTLHGESLRVMELASVACP